MRIHFLGWALLPTHDDDQPTGAGELRRPLAERVSFKGYVYVHGSTVIV